MIGKGDEKGIKVDFFAADLALAEKYAGDGCQRADLF